MPGDTIAVMEADLLDLSASLLTLGAPDRRYVAQGEPPFDCEQLTVHLVRLMPKLIDPRFNRCAVIWQATLAIVLVRCEVPIPDKKLMPSAAALDANHQNLAVDVWDLASGLSRAWATGAWPTGVDCSDVEWLPWEPFTPGVQGGLTGWRGSVKVSLTGPAPGS